MCTVMSGGIGVHHGAVLSAHHGAVLSAHGTSGVYVDSDDSVTSIRRIR